MNTIERFWSRVVQSDGCWEWIGSHFQGTGYSRFCPSHEKSIYAHRFSYELHRGQIPQGLVVDHLCRNHGCVNPDHLEAVTMRTNILRGIGVAAHNIVKTSCPNGHELSESNLAQYQLRVGKRSCRRCSNARLRIKRSIHVKNPHGPYNVYGQPSKG